MNEKEREHLRGLMGDVAILQAQMAAQEQCFFGLAIALHRKGRLPIGELLPTLEFMQQDANLSQSPDVGGAMQHIIDNLHAVAEFDDPRLPIAMNLLLYVETPASQKEALRTWLAQAHPDEISDEMLKAWSRLRPPSTPGGGDPAGGGEMDES